jgi:hypothetical protein
MPGAEYITEARLTRDPFRPILIDPIALVADPAMVTSAFAKGGYL